MFQIASELLHDTSESSVTDEGNHPQFVTEELQRHHWYVWDEHVRVEFTTGLDKGLWAMGVASNKAKAKESSKARSGDFPSIDLSIR